MKHAVAAERAEAFSPFKIDTAASQLYLGGMDLLAIQTTLGHAWIATTMCWGLVTSPSVAVGCRPGFRVASLGLRASRPGRSNCRR